MFELSITIHQVETRINEESERAKHYLDPSTEEPIVKVKEFVSGQSEILPFLVPVALLLINCYVKDCYLKYCIS